MTEGTKERLDVLLVERGISPTRSKARDLIRRGCVQVNDIVITKPGSLTQETAEIGIIGPGNPYVSRGGLKLAAALGYFSFSAEGRTALDLGASTGGFTEVLLENGAKTVYAVDIGQDQLHQKLKADPRVVSLEGTDVRELNSVLFSHDINAITADLSFISLKKALVVPLMLASPGAWLIALVKPQFEAGREAVGKGGIVKDEGRRMQAVQDVRIWIGDQPGWSVFDVIPSPIAGQGGNQEFLLGAVYES